MAITRGIFGHRIVALIALLPILLLLLSVSAQAQIGSDRYSSIVVDAATGRVLSAVNPDDQRHPASLTKMMTLYMVFEALRDRRIGLNQLVPVSPHAASMEPSKLGLVPGTRITVQEAILGIVTKSANDAAAALAELLGGGSEERFGQMMTLRARALGMSHTELHNASGLPDPDQWTSAHDLAVLARHLLRDFPQEYRYFSTENFRFHGRMILGHDNLLRTYPGADGIKTGYTDASGFNLVTSAVRSNVRLIGVVMGAAHAGERDLHMAVLLDQGFEQMDVPIAIAHASSSRPESSGIGLIATAHAASLPRAQPVRWSLQVGAFPNEAAARQAAAAARRQAGVGDVRLEPVVVRGKANWRAQLGGLSEAEARGACAMLVKHRQACTVLRPDPNQLASR